MSVADNIRAFAKEAEPRIEQWLDAADALADIRDAAKEKGIDWSALKALLVARARDNKDGGDRFETMTRKLDVRLGYADMLTMPPIVAEQSKTSATISKFPSAPVASKATPPRQQDRVGAAGPTSGISGPAATNSDLGGESGNGEGRKATNATVPSAPLATAAGTGGSGGTAAALLDPLNCIPEFLARV